MKAIQVSKFAHPRDLAVCVPPLLPPPSSLFRLAPGYGSISEADSQLRDPGTNAQEGEVLVEISATGLNFFE